MALDLVVEIKENSNDFPSVSAVVPSAMNTLGYVGRGTASNE